MMGLQRGWVEGCDMLRLVFLFYIQMLLALVLSIILSTISSATFKQIPHPSQLSSFSSQFDNATILKTSKSYTITSKSRTITILNVPDVYQATDYTCGPSSLTAVLSYYGKEDIREMDIAKLAKTDEEVGTMPEKLHRAIVNLGFRAEIRQNMTVSSLTGLLSAGRPVIVLIQAWKDDDTTSYEYDFQDGHYVVAIGYDNDYIYFQDPWIHGSLTFMAKGQLSDRWHGDTDEPYDRRIYGSGIIVTQPLVSAETVIYLQ